MDTREETATRKNNCLKYINKHFLFKLHLLKKTLRWLFFHSGNLSRLPKVDRSVDRCVTVLFRGPSKLESVLDSIDCSKSVLFMQLPQNDPTAQAAMKIATFELFFFEIKEEMLFWDSVVQMSKTVAAVSQISNLTVTSSRQTVCVRKAAPIVDSWWSWNDARLIQPANYSLSRLKRAQKY